MSKSRVGLTLRFNPKELLDLQALCEFWKRPEKDVLKLAFYQLVSATNQLQNKLAAQQQVSEAAANETTTPTEETPAAS